ncbi:MAG: hypothetical protein K5793_04290 [Nitrosarchaeum sp.]|nr:hypothetical protein [Nitrosarchaeum sp.]
MISIPEIVEIIHNRQDLFDKWTKKNPEKFSIPKLKNELKFWRKEIDDAIELTKINDPLFTKNDFGKIYTFLNEAMATQCCYYADQIYIRKLEKEISRLNSSKK